MPGYPPTHTLGYFHPCFVVADLTCGPVAIGTGVGVAVEVGFLLQVVLVGRSACAPFVCGLFAFRRSFVRSLVVRSFDAGALVVCFFCWFFSWGCLLCVV